MTATGDDFHANSGKRFTLREVAAKFGIDLDALADEEDFYEDDEPLDDALRAFRDGEKFVTAHKEPLSTSDAIGQRVSELRKQRRLTIEQLAAMCAEAGATRLTNNALENIEYGRRDKTGRRRRKVDVSELLALAWVLVVPVVSLVVSPDVGDDEAFEIAGIATTAGHVRTLITWDVDSELPAPAHATLDEIRANWPPTLAVPTAAEVLGISASGSYELIKRGEFPCRVLKVGNRYRVVTSSLVRLLEADDASLSHPDPHRRVPLEKAVGTVQERYGDAIRVLGSS